MSLLFGRSNRNFTRKVRYEGKRTLTFLVLLSMIVGLTSPGTTEVAASSGQIGPNLVVTEILPDNAGTDDYEFFEVYNNTNQTLQLSDYKLFYRYTNMTTPDIQFNFPDRTLQPHDVVMFWNNTKSGAISAFNTKYGVALDENHIINVTGTGFTSFANSADRSVVIKDSQDKEIAIATYTAADIGTGLGVHYQWTGSAEESKNKVKAAPTPGTVSPDQLPFVAPVNLPPAIGHTPPTLASNARDLVIQADITDQENQSSVTGIVYYKLETASVYQSVYMSPASGTSFMMTIPKSELTGTAVNYYIAATDGEALAQTPVYTVPVLIEPENADYTKVPQLLVTELVPDSANVGTADGFEFVELYNNTNQDINLKDYKIQYRYTDSGPGADVVWPTIREDIMIPSGKTVVFWVINAQNTTKTIADFNTNYGTNLKENEEVFRMYSDGMANGGKRGIVIATNARQEISAAYYDNDNETVSNKGIFYRYPVDGSTTMLKYSAGLEAATPGRVDSVQVPTVPVKPEADLISPTCSNVGQVTEVSQEHDLVIKADVKDNTSVKSVALFFKDNLETTYTKRYLVEDYNDMLYHYRIDSPSLIGKKYIEYYFVVSDGTQEVTSETYRVTINGGPDHSALRLNVKDGDILSGSKLIKGTAEQAPAEELTLMVDGKPVTEQTYAALENDAYFAFEATNVNYYFKNAVTAGQEILYTFQDPINTYTTLTVPISAKRLKLGSNLLSIRAGSKSGPFDDRVEENKDDFDIRNVRLVLSNGTELRDPRFTNKEQIIKMGDGSGRKTFVDFDFQLTANQLAAKSFVLDTRSLTDGEHSITVSHPVYGQKTVAVKADNTAPTILPTVEEGQLYRGVFTLDAQVTDGLAGVKSIESLLDGQPIKMPYNTASYQLSAGSHQFVVKALDQAGNKAEVSISFKVPEENPGKPELVAPQQNQTIETNLAKLSVKVTDPENDKLKVSFYKGFKHDAAAKDKFAGYRNAAEVEPPKQKAPEGERAFSEEDYNQIRAVDGQYLIDDGVEQFPYQRFEIKLDPSVKPTDQAAILWQGKSLEGRKVTLYAWSPSAQNWVKLDQHVAGTEDFKLEANVAVGDYAEDGRILTMIQDEIAPAPVNFDYSFVWMSDTQYYSKSYPRIYDSIVNWIVKNKESNNIKYVFHTGDIVDESDKLYQWENADKSMKVLEDANIPYGVLAGNHDVNHQFGTYDNYWTHYGENRFKTQPTYGESYKNNMGHYDLISANGNDYIFLYMGWGLADEEIAWLNDVLKQYPDRKAILSFHEYLLVSGNRAPIADRVFEEVIKKNPNVFAALSGHYHDSELLVDEIDDNGDGTPDRKVYQMLADYQGADEGGSGYIRLMKFDTTNNKLYIQTYSPHLNDYNYYNSDVSPGKDEFVFDLDLKPLTKRVATDYFGVNVYTDQLIKTSNDVDSGAIVTANWYHLQEGKKYEWYAEAQDPFGGKSTSDIWPFIAGKNIDDSPTPNPDAAIPVPSPGGVNNTIPHKGNIVPERKADGTYAVNKETLKAAVSNAANQEEIVVSIAGSSANAAVQLQLDGEGTRQAIEKKTSLKIVSDDLIVTVPSEALKNGTKDADSIVFQFSTALTDDIKAEVKAAELKDEALQSSNMVITLHLISNRGEGKNQVHQFEAPITVTRTLSDDQLRGMNPDFAGVYYIHDGQADYVGGKINGKTITFTINHFSNFAIMEYRKQFDDMAGHWADTAVKKLAAKHIVSGVDENLFAPDRDVTRADFAIMAVKALGKEEGEASKTFADVSADRYYAQYVARAAELGLIEGDGTNYHPDAAITREEAMVILIRLNNALKQGQAGEQAIAEFEDLGQASEWAQPSIREAQAFGLINGREGNRFEPKAMLTRAEIAKILSELVSR